jgi:hypothetical protein
MRRTRGIGIEEEEEDEYIGKACRYINILLGELSPVLVVVVVVVVGDNNGRMKL